MAEHQPFYRHEVGTVADDVRWEILSPIANRCGQVPDVHPRLLEGIEVAARKIASEYLPGEVARGRMERAAARNGNTPPSVETTVAESVLGLLIGEGILGVSNDDIVIHRVNDTEYITASAGQRALVARLMEEAVQ